MNAENQYDPFKPVKEYAARFEGMSKEERKITQAIFQREEAAIRPERTGDCLLFFNDPVRQKKLYDANRILERSGLFK